MLRRAFTGLAIGNVGTRGDGTATEAAATHARSLDRTARRDGPICRPTRVLAGDPVAGSWQGKQAGGCSQNRGVCSLNCALYVYAGSESGRTERQGRIPKTAFLPGLRKKATPCISLRKGTGSANTLDRDRTCNLQLRRLTLYPIELRGRGQKLTSPDHPAVAAPPRLFSAWEPAACHRRARPRGRDFVRRAHRLAMPWEDDVSPHLRPNRWRSPEAPPPALDPRAPPGLTPTFAEARNPAADASGPKGPRAPRRSGSSFPGRSLRCPPPPPPCPPPDSRSTAGDARRG